MPDLEIERPRQPIGKAQPSDHGQYRFSDVLFSANEELYAALSHPEYSRQAQSILDVRHWLSSIVDFDAATGSALGTDLLTMAHRVALDYPVQPIQDRVYRLVQHVQSALRFLLQHMREHIVREHAMVPIYAAREIDSSGVQWVSRQTGRTLREKLSAKPYIKAVQRRASLDSAENRLLKAFVIKFEQLIQSRLELSSSAQDEALTDMAQRLQYWLRREEIQSISIWKNLSPNNALLQDKHYRKVWHSWLAIQHLNDKLIEDQLNIDQHRAAVLYWKLASALVRSGIRVPQQPIESEPDQIIMKTRLEIIGMVAVDVIDIKGVVDTITIEKNYGFIKKSSGEKVFFHKSGLKIQTKLSDLNVGDVVSFGTRQNEKGKEEAFNVEKACSAKKDGSIKLRLEDSRVLINVATTETSLHVKGDMVHRNDGSVHQYEKIDIQNVVNDALLKGGLDRIVFKKNNKAPEPLQYDEVMLDFFALQPEFIGDGEQPKKLPFTLLWQYWKNVGHVDCRYAKALYLTPDTQTFSMANLYLEREGSEALKKEMLKNFIHAISGQLVSKSLTYLVPDEINIFVQDDLRRCVNFYYPDAVLLPKSIAAVFDWFRVESPEQLSLKENDFIFVLDHDVDCYSVTPVEAKYDAQLAKVLPSSKGLYWERHPSFTFSLAKYRQRCLEILSEGGGQQSADILDMLGFEGLISKAGKFSAIDGLDQWYHLPDALQHSIALNPPSAAIKAVFDKVCDPKSDGKVYLLPAKASIKHIPKPSKDWTVLPFGSALEGARCLGQWQQLAGDFPLWRDHLPELSIKAKANGRYRQIYLVKDTTVVPRREKAIRIPISGKVPLAAGKLHYKFPLFLGDGNQHVKYEAYLRSPAFPLAIDIMCELKMIYRYGAESPYELSFVAEHPEQAGFKSIQVQWQPQSEIEVSDLPVPEFPALKSIEELRRFPKKDSTETSDMLEWVTTSFDSICELEGFLSTGQSATRYCIELEDVSWRVDKNGNTFTKIDWEDDTLFIHENDYVAGSFSTDATIISFDRRQGGQGLTAKNISIGHTLHPDTCKNLKKRVRFPILATFAQGRSIADLPQSVQDKVRDALDAAESIMEMDDTDLVIKELQKELLFLYSALHQDAPDWVVAKLQAPDMLKHSFMNVAFAIGHASKAWQQDLLAQICAPNDDRTLAKRLEILSIVLWRSDHLLAQIPTASIKFIAEVLPKLLVQNTLSAEREVGQPKKNYPLQSLLKNLELLLALLRVRGLDDQEKKGLFNPNSKLVQQYITSIEQVDSLLVSKKRVVIKSRIDMQVDKPEDLSNTPDLLYALKKYLDGDDGANGIKIVGIAEDE